MVKPLRSDGAETRALLKQEAQRLFAQRGMDGVTIQDIITAAAQKNSASLRYYFGTKEALVRELIVDGARLIDEDRLAMLGTLEAEGTIDLRNVLLALVQPMLDLVNRTGQATYIRMIANLQLNHRDFLRKALENKWNGGYRRCLSHLREILGGTPPEVLDHRLSLIGIYGNAVLAAWETHCDAGKGSRLWATDYAISSVIDSFESMLSAPPSAETRQALRLSRRGAEGPRTGAPDVPASGGRRHRR